MSEFFSQQFQNYEKKKRINKNNNHWRFIQRRNSVNLFNHKLFKMAKVKIKEVQSLCNASFVGKAVIRLKSGKEVNLFGVIPYCVSIDNEVVRLIEKVQQFSGLQTV